MWCVSAAGSAEARGSLKLTSTGGVHSPVGSGYAQHLLGRWGVRPNLSLEVENRSTQSENADAEEALLHPNLP